MEALRHFTRYLDEINEGITLVNPSWISGEMPLFLEDSLGISPDVDFSTCAHRVIRSCHLLILY